MTSSAWMRHPLYKESPIRLILFLNRINRLVKALILFGSASVNTQMIISLILLETAMIYLGWLAYKNNKDSSLDHKLVNIEPSTIEPTWSSLGSEIMR